MFKVGDKVRRKPEDRAGFWSDVVARNNCSVSVILTVSSISKPQNRICFEEFPRGYDMNRFELADTIKVGDVYKNTNGEDVRIVCVDRADPEFPIIGLCKSVFGYESSESYTVTGKYLFNSDTNCPDLILPWNEPKTDWANVPVDAVVDIAIGNHKAKQHFAKYEDGKVYVFHDGKSSKTVTSKAHISFVSSKYCKLITD